MMCQRIGWSPISIIGLGFKWLSSEIRVPYPPARMTTFMKTPPKPVIDWTFSIITHSVTPIHPKLYKRLRNGEQKTGIRLMLFSARTRHSILLRVA